MFKVHGPRQLRGHRGIESLESRLLLDAGLGSEFAQFASEDALKSSLVEQAVERYGYLFGQPVDPWRWWEGCINCDVLLTESPPPGAPDDAGGGAATLFSETNTQVAGVDEGDVIETDGDYVYLLSANQLTIIDVQTPAHPRVASRVTLDDVGYASEIYLDEDRLMVLSTNWDYYGEPMWSGGGVPPLAVDGPFVDFVGPGGFFPQPSREHAIATVLDVTDREQPEIVSRTEIDGSLRNSRAIHDHGYLVIEDYLDFPYPEAKEIATAAEPDGPKVERVYESEQEYRARIDSFILDVLPSYATFDGAGNEVASGRLTGLESMYRTDDPDTTGMISVVTIDMYAELPTAEASSSVMAASGYEIYMSADNLYVFQPKWNRIEETSILKFEINPDDDSVRPVASGVVPGRMLDQFSADEHHGDLRLATTTGWGPESSSGVYVLEQSDDDLVIKGSVEKLAPGEQIYSVRFLNYEAYVVTFRQVDPLFAISLADPENPKVEGEVKITGFSEYLMPIGEHYLLGIGRDADPQTGISTDLQISLFDVSDMTNPRLVDRYNFAGGQSSWSLAEYDHHAVGYYPEFATLAIPVRGNSGGGVWIPDESGGGEWVVRPEEHALHVFTIDVDAGITFVDAIEHPSEVLRSIRVGDSLLSASYDTLKINPIQDPATLTGQLHYLPPLTGGVVPPKPLPGDIDRLFQQVATAANPPEFDMDGNALVNEDDVEFILHAVMNTDYGDADLDGDVDFADFLALSSNFGQEGGWADGDFDGDGLVGFSDFTILSGNFGR